MSEYTTVKYCSKCEKRQSFLCSGSGRIQICEECGTEYDEVELPNDLEKYGVYPKDSWETENLE